MGIALRQACGWTVEKNLISCLSKPQLPSALVMCNGWKGVCCTRGNPSHGVLAHQGRPYAVDGRSCDCSCANLCHKFCTPLTFLCCMCFFSHFQVLQREADYQILFAPEASAGLLVLFVLKAFVSRPNQQQWQEKKLQNMRFVQEEPIGFGNSALCSANQTRGCLSMGIC